MQKRIKAIGHGKLLGVCDCYVLDGGVRALSKAGFMALLRGETVSAKHADFDRSISRLPSRFVGLAGAPNIEFVLPQGGIGHAIDADTAIEICCAYDDADDAGELRADQERFARGARRLVRAAAKVGLAALVDEATGYEAVRERGDLSRLFSDRLGVWEETFSPELTRRMCQLGIAGDRYRSWNCGSYPQPLAAPFRRIYDLIIGKDAARKLKLMNENPRQGSNHHQWLTEEARDLLKKNLGIVLFCAKTSNTREEFWQRLSDHYKGQGNLVYAA